MMQTYKLLSAIFLLLSVSAFSQENNGANDTVDSSIVDKLFKSEIATAAKAERGDLITALIAQRHGASTRSRIAEIKPGTLITGSEIIELNPFDDVKVRVRRDKITYHENGGFYVWEGFVQDNRFPEGRFNTLSPEEIAPMTIEQLKRGLLGVRFTITEWGRDTTTGKVKKRRHASSPDRVFGTDPTIVEDEGVVFENFHTIRGTIRIPNSDSILAVEPAKSDPEFHVVFEVRRRDIVEATDDFSVDSEGGREWLEWARQNQRDTGNNGQVQE